MSDASCAVQEEEDKSAQVWRGCVERGMRRFGERMGEAGQRCEEAAAPSVPLSKPPARERRQKPERSPQAGTDGEEDEAEGVGDGDEVNATVVTAYFEVPSKFGSEVYRHWMHNFLARVKTPMVSSPQHRVVIGACSWDHCCRVCGDMC
eukprot:3939258-Rhodomonas_salina.1